MSSINTCVFTGNVGADPESFTYGDKQGARFGVAVKLYARGGEEKTAWVNLTAFNGVAEKLVLPYVKKGMKVTVVCAYEPNVVEKDGRKVTYPGFILRDIELPPKGISSDVEAPDRQDAPAAPQQTDDLPF